MTPRLPDILDDRYLPAAELRAAELDGELFSLGHGFVSPDTPTTAAMRAASLSSQMPARTTIGGRSAAWVWGWIRQPGPLTLCVSTTARIASSARRKLAIREVVIDADEIVNLDGQAITSPVRTLVDLARFDDGDDAVSVLAHGLTASGISLETALTALDRRPAAAGRRRARVRLQSAGALVVPSAVADAVDVIHGVDAANRVEHTIQVRDIAHLEHEAAERKSVA
jgi:hypothetical protein